MTDDKNTLSYLFQVTEVELIYRNKVPSSERKRVESSSTAFDVFLSSWDMNKIELLEQFKILLLDTSNRCLGLSDISTGGVSSCIVDPRIVFSTALKAKASSVILAHNHPSGNLSPSKADMTLTEQLIEGGKLLQIKVYDHLILSQTHYRSMQDDGLIPSFY